MTATENKHIVVIGAGAAGLMAAGRAAERGHKVTLIDKMPLPARKLRITGKGRCNITNTAERADFLTHFGKNSRFLKPVFNQFFSDSMIELLEKLDVPTMTERGGRVFPTSEQAQDVVDALMRYCQQNQVTVKQNLKTTKIRTKNGVVSGVEVVGCRKGRATIEKPRFMAADAVILATGGASYPGSGSTGDGYEMAKGVGHSLIPVRPALVPLNTEGKTAEKLQGLSLKNANVTLWCDGKKQGEAFGEMLFTHFGLSGPIILTLSKAAVDALAAKQNVEISIDLKPALDHAKLDARLLRDFNTHGLQQFKTLLRGLLPTSLIPVCIELSGINADKPAHQISAAERKRLRNWFKDFRFKVTGTRAIAEAIITAGGVSIKEVSPKTMVSRLVPGLYFAGEVLDIDADTGGYNLQAAFSTGWVAGNSI
ncbi:NAD(P)/FAD-dependent oxidoreductase [bacterium]|nr:NAD(P)/FAD-dependent oxidoreductase [bacterium]